MKPSKEFLIDLEETSTKPTSITTPTDASAACLKCSKKKTNAKSDKLLIKQKYSNLPIYVPSVGEKKLKDRKFTINSFASKLKDEKEPENKLQKPYWLHGGKVDKFGAEAIISRSKSQSQNMAKKKSQGSMFVNELWSTKQIKKIIKTSKIDTDIEKESKINRADVVNRLECLEKVYNNTHYVPNNTSDVSALMNEFKNQGLNDPILKKRMKQPPTPKKQSQQIEEGTTAITTVTSSSGVFQTSKTLKLKDRRPPQPPRKLLKSGSEAQNINAARKLKANTSLNIPSESLNSINLGSSANIALSHRISTSNRHDNSIASIEEDISPNSKNSSSQQNEGVPNGGSVNILINGNTYQQYQSPYTLTNAEVEALFVVQKGAVSSIGDLEQAQLNKKSSSYLPDVTNIKKRDEVNLEKALQNIVKEEDEGERKKADRMKLRRGSKSKTVKLPQQFERRSSLDMILRGIKNIRNNKENQNGYEGKKTYYEPESQLKRDLYPFQKVPRNTALIGHLSELVKKEGR